MAGGGAGDGERLLPRPLHRPALVLAAACAAVLTGLAVRYHGSARPGGLDERVFDALARAPLPLGLLARVVDLVPPASVGVVVVLTLGLAARRRGRAAAFAALGPGLALLVTEVGKRLVGRSLDGQLALPSGHTTGVASVAAVVAVLLVGRSRHVHRAAVLGLLAVTLATAAIGVLMVALHVHYATDVLAGWCVAVAVPLAVALGIDGLPHRDHGEAGSDAEGVGFEPTMGVTP